jgi:hypothetical protein
VDADHIEGLLELLRTPSPLRIGDVWFNGHRHINQARGRSVGTPRARLPVSDDRSEILSIAQGLELSALIERRGAIWNKAFGGGPILVDRDQPLPTIELFAGGKITLLGPTRSKLSAFAPDWDSAFAAAEATLGGARERPFPCVGQIERIAAEYDRPDRAKANGSSIAFIVEFAGRRALFTGDAHPDDLCSALQRFAPNDDYLMFELVKAPHHGSAKNNTSELLKRLAGRRWLISSNGSRHQHPDPEAIARIVLTATRISGGLDLVFNYRTEFTAPWEDKGLQDAHGFRTHFAGCDKPYSIDLAKSPVAERTVR